jgi:hypothetical protein
MGLMLGIEVTMSLRCRFLLPWRLTHLPIGKRQGEHPLFGELVMSGCHSLVGLVRQRHMKEGLRGWREERHRGQHGGRVISCYMGCAGIGISVEMVD